MGGSHNATVKTSVPLSPDNARSCASRDSAPAPPVAVCACAGLFGAQTVQNFLLGHRWPRRPPRDVSQVGAGDSRPLRHVLRDFSVKIPLDCNSPPHSSVLVWVMRSPRIQESEWEESPSRFLKDVAISLCGTRANWHKRINLGNERDFPPHPRRF